jgi:hypothetical protein
MPARLAIRMPQAFSADHFLQWISSEFAAS